MSKSADYVRLWRTKTKQKLIAAMGGGCICCGYNKCIRALEFHHLSSEAKDSTISNMMVHPRKLETLMEEAKKCILVCANCHREIHAGEREAPGAIWDDAIELLKTKTIKMKPCPVCSKEIPESHSTCSRECAIKYQSNTDWDHIDLYDLLVTQEMSYRKLGSILGVSDNAVKKQAKKRGIVLIRNNKNRMRLTNRKLSQLQNGT